MWGRSVRVDKVQGVEDAVERVCRREARTWSCMRGGRMWRRGVVGRDGA